MRKLVTVRTVKELLPIEGADRIELAKIDGWQCVVKKGEFQVGDPGLYFEIDSVLPADDERFAFLEPRKFRIKSMRLRGTLSQGLMLPLSALTSEEYERWQKSAQTDEGETLTEILRVQKYEPPLPISGEQAGPFPTHLVPKTDQERIQNIPDVLDGRSSLEFEITEKLDGTSCTMFCQVQSTDPLGLRLGVCSRNWEMKVEDGNVYAVIFKELDLGNKLRKLNRNIAIQGEIIGGRIQRNHYQRGQQEFYVFDIWDIDKQGYLSHQERFNLVQVLGLRHVPVLDIRLEDPMTLERILDTADGQSVINPQVAREGLVFKALDGSISFKAISNRWLLKHE